MPIAALSWPQAAVYVALIATAGLFLGALIWSIFRTGQTAIRSDSRHHEPVDELRKEMDDLRATIGRLGP